MSSSRNSFFVMGLAFYLIVTFLSLDMYLPALPSISQDLGFTKDMTQYTLTVWFLGSASMQLFLGPIADYIGRKIVLLIGACIFILSTIACSVLDNYFWLLVCRFLQGATVCSTIVAGYSTVHEVFKGEQSVQMLSILSSITILAPALGPLAGAYIITSLSWRYIFVLLSVLGVVSLCIHMIYMPSKQSNSGALSFSNIFHSYKEIVKNIRFMQFVGSNFFLTSVFFIWVVESPFIIIETLQKSPVFFGYAQMPIFAGFIVGGQITRLIITKVTVKTVMHIGLLLALVGSIGFMLAAYIQSIYCVLIAMTILSIGSSMTFGPFNRLTIESSDQPMGQRVAITSMATSCCGIVASFVITLISEVTFFNTAIFILSGVVLSIAMFLSIKNVNIAS